MIENFLSKEGTGYGEKWGKYFRRIEVKDLTTVISFWCPGCNHSHSFNSTWYVEDAEGEPTVLPSILCKMNWSVDSGRKDRVCHSFIRSGNIEYLSDCTHDLAGKTIKMKEIEE